MENIINNEELMKKLAAVETVEELMKVFEENSITLEEGVTAQQFLDTMKGTQNEELNEDDLDDVSGGIIVSTTAAAAVVAGAAGLALALYLRKRKK